MGDSMYRSKKNMFELQIIQDPLVGKPTIIINFVPYRKESVEENSIIFPLVTFYYHNPKHQPIISMPLYILVIGLLEALTLANFLFLWAQVQTPGPMTE